MKIGLVGGSYQNKYTAVNTRRVINWFIHKDLIEDGTEGSKYRTAYLPFPGLTSLVNTAGTNLRKIFVARTLTYTRCFIVADNILYETDELGTLTNRGTMSNMSTGADAVYMEVNGGNQIMISHSSASYIYDLSTDTLTQITDGDFPGSVTFLSYTTGYFFVCSGGRVYFSNLNDGLNWTSTDIFTPTAHADNTLAALVWSDEIHCFGTETIEIYINDGSTPFSKQPRTTIDIGLLSVDTLCLCDTGMIFVGKTRKGQYNVYFYDGMKCMPIAPLDLAYKLNDPAVTQQTIWDNLTTYTWDQWYDLWDATIDTSYADIQYSKHGHILYHLTIPPLKTTYVFDLSTKEWTERNSYDPNSGQQREFRGKWMVNFKGVNLMTDLYSGKILKEDYSVRTEDSQVITRTIISQVVSNEKKNLSFYDFELETTTGIGLTSTPATAATLSVYLSRDGGNTYGSAITVSTGATTEYTKRPRILKLGTARDWVFKIVQTDAADLAIQEAIVHGVVDNY